MANTSAVAVPGPTNTKYPVRPDLSPWFESIILAQDELDSTVLALQSPDELVHHADNILLQLDITCRRLGENKGSKYYGVGCALYEEVLARSNLDQDIKLRAEFGSALLQFKKVCKASLRMMNSGRLTLHRWGRNESSNESQPQQANVASDIDVRVFIFNHSFVEVWESLIDVLQAEEKSFRGAKRDKAVEDLLRLQSIMAATRVTLTENGFLSTDKDGTRRIFTSLKRNGQQLAEDDRSSIQALKNMRNAVAHSATAVTGQPLVVYESRSSRGVRNFIQVEVEILVELQSAFLLCANDEVITLILERYDVPLDTAGPSNS